MSSDKINLTGDVLDIMSQINKIKPLYRDTSPTLFEHEMETSTQPSTLDGTTIDMLALNRDRLGPPVQPVKENHGYVFFTRPQLNLSDANLQVDRLFLSLANNDPYSVQSYIRSMLDPSLLYRTNNKTKNSFYDTVNKDPANTFGCELIDNKSAFITIMSNRIKSLSGMPDMVVPTYTSKQGIRKEQWSMVDGSMYVYEKFDVSVSFQSTRHEVILLLLYYWEMYMTYVHEGRMYPYMEMIAANEIDYNTRIWRILLDESGSKVTKIGCTGASFPTSVPMGKMFDFNSDNLFTTGNNEVGTTFTSVGACYLDPILIDEFNDLQAIFNRDMLESVLLGNEQVKLRKYYQYAVRNGKSMGRRKYPTLVVNTGSSMYKSPKAYPRIDPVTMRLEWWVTPLEIK